jgi:thiamine-phosphate pyrophosphorylase
LSVADARKIVGEDMLIGVSTHSLAQARQATDTGASYIGCGPTFPSTTKSFETYPGLDFLRAVRDLATPPAFAIGGVDGDNLRLVLGTGFQRVAVSGVVVNARDPAGVVHKMKAEIAAFVQSGLA